MLATRIKTSVKSLFVTLILASLFTIPTTVSAQIQQQLKKCKAQTEYYKSPDFIKSVFYKKCDPKTYTSSTSYKIKLEYQDKELKMKSEKPCSGSVQIFKDEYEIYDCSYKQFRIESDAIDVEYTIYYLSNCIVLKFDNKRFIFNVIDGGCDVHIKNLKHTFKYKSGTETMKIKAKKDIVLFEDDNPNKSSVVLKKGSEFKFVTRDTH